MNNSHDKLTLNMAQFVDGAHSSFVGEQPSVFNNIGIGLSEVEQLTLAEQIVKVFLEFSNVLNTMASSQRNQFKSDDQRSGTWTAQRKTRQNVQSNKSNYCSFCKNNGELEQTYLSHDLKDSMKRVQCPRLRAYTCKRCGATGDNAHTIRYCPVPQQALATESVHARQQSW